MTLLAVSDVDLTINGTRILAEVSFTVREKEVLGLIGPNGAGKSSILNCIAGIYAPQRGVVQFDGKSVFSAPPHALAAWGVARTFQAVSLDAGATVRENVMLGADLPVTWRRSRSWVPHRRRRSARAADEALERLNLSDIAGERAGRLPYGIQRSIELARAVAMRPRLLCLDEPTSGMSPAEKRGIADLLVDLRGKGLTLLIIEHDVPFMTSLCDRLVALNFGRVLASGTPSDVLASKEVIESYLHPAGTSDIEELEREARSSGVGA